MADTLSLPILLRGQVIGDILSSGSEKLSLRYSEQWIEEGFPLSPHLKLDSEFGEDSPSVKRYIQNLFPEGNAFKALLETNNLSERHLYSILSQVGNDVAGGMTFTQQQDVETRLIEISEEELNRRIDSDDARDMAVWEGKYRLSVAGVQRKLNVWVDDDGSLNLAEGEFASTHILKFASKTEPNIVFNEYISMCFAGIMGLPVANVELIKIGAHQVLQVERYDRKKAERSVLRRHIIDGCQALDRSPADKYERNYGSGRDVKHIRDGVTLKQVFSLSESCIIPGITKQQLLDWVLFNALIGNSDAHGKNLSFFFDHNGMTLAPFYDLVSVELEAQNNANLDIEMAMAIEDNFDASSVTAYQLLVMAKQANIKPSQLKLTIKNIINNVDSSLQKLQKHAADCESYGENSRVLESFCQLVKARSVHLNQQLQEFNEVVNSAF